MYCPLIDEEVDAKTFCGNCAGHVVEPAYKMAVAGGVISPEPDVIEIPADEYCIL